jgi:hypothetical protein
MKNKQMPSFDELLEKIQALLTALLAIPGFTWDDDRHPWFGEDLADAKEASERDDRSEVSRILASLVPKLRGVGAAFIRRSPSFYEAKVESFAREIGERQDQDLVGRLRKALTGYKTFIAQLTDPIEDFAPASEAMGSMLALLTEAREERARREKRREERFAEERAKALAAKKAVEEVERAAKEAAREEKMREERTRRAKGLESLAGLLQRPTQGASASV